MRSGEEVLDLSMASMAKVYVRMGFAVLPVWSTRSGRCACGDDDCESPGKHPIGRLAPEGSKSATRKLETVRLWWTEEPNANIAIRCGQEAGIVAIDIDPRNGGDATWAALTQAHGLPHTLTAHSGGGGLHYFFKWREGLPSTLGPGIDVKSPTDGYVLVSPSTHVSGGIYQWRQSLDVSITELPPWLASKSQSPNLGKEAHAVVFKGGRNSYLTRLAGVMRRGGVSRLAIEAALIVENDQRCNPPLPTKEVEGIARSIARYEPAAAKTSNRGISQARLMANEYRPLTFYLDGIIPTEGLVMFGGQKKRGKSYWVLQQASDMGQKVGVLYFALEDGERRLNRRLKEQRADPSADVIYHFELAIETKEEREEFKAMLIRSGRQVVIVDNLARVKSSKTDEDKAGPMGDIVHWLQQVAMELSITVIVVHHHGKTETGDPGNDLRGSSAIAAAGDVNLGLYREEGHFILRGEGRDIDPLELRLDRERDTRTWRILGEEEAIAREERFQRVRDALGDAELDVNAVASQLGIERRTASERLAEAVNAGCVVVREVKGRTGPKKVYQWRGFIED